MNKVQMHEQICNELNSIYEKKNNDYGDSFAIVRKKVDNAILVRLWDKLLRLDTLMSGKEQRVNESIDDTLLDLANYAIMELLERAIDRRKNEQI
jgi:alpha-glucuronidase